MKGIYIFPTPVGQPFINATSSTCGKETRGKK